MDENIAAAMEEIQETSTCKIEEEGVDEDGDGTEV